MFFKKKAQIGMEFMLVTAVALFTLIVFLIVLTHIMSNKQEEKILILAEDLALSIKNELVFASDAEPGYSRVVHLPKTIEGVSYEVVLLPSIYNTGHFELNILGSSFFESIPLTNGVIEPGSIRISKREFDVFVEVLS